MSNIKGETDGWVQSLWVIFNALTFLSLKDERLYLPHYNDLKIVNVYKAPGIEGDDWEQYLNKQAQLWIITRLYYLNNGSRNVRIASGGGRWNGRTCKLKKLGSTSWYERKYNLVERRNEHQDTEGGAGLQNYTMFEYSPVETKPSHALCRITIYNKNNAPDRPLSSSQQQEGKEIDHGNKGHKGGNFQNTTADYNQQILEEKLRELIKDHSFADIRKVLDRIESEKLPAASPKGHITEAPVSNTTHGRCTCTNTMEAGTSTKWQEQAKVEMFESKTYQEKPTNLRCDTNRNCLQKNDEEDRIYWEQLLSSCNTDGCFKWDDIRSDKNCMQLDSELAELIANGQEHNQLSHNFNANSTVAMDYQNRIEPYPSTSNFATTEGRFDHQMVESNAHFQDPKLYHNINGNSTEQVLNNNHLPSWNGNISAAFMGGWDEQEFEQNVQDPYNFNVNLTEPTENGRYLPFCFAPTVPPITDQGTYNAIQEQQFPLCNTPHGQMFESDANVLDPTENGNHLPIYNQNTIAPGLDENNNATAEPEDMDWRNYPDLSATIDWNRV